MTAPELDHPPAGGVAPEKILQGYFTGQREALRTYKFMDVRVQGTGGTFVAQVINISRSGMLFRITDPTFATEAESSHLMPYTARVWSNFQGGFHVHLEEGAIARAARIVRVSGYCSRKSSLVLIGCQFDRELSPEDCAVLDIAYGDDEAPAAS